MSEISARVNQLIDQVENGSLSPHAFLEDVTRMGGLSEGIGPLVQAEGDNGKKETARASAAIGRTPAP